jgi:hypothetical protein
VTSTSPELRDAVTVWLERTATPVPIAAAEAASLLVRTANDPCALALAHVLGSDIQKTAAERARHLDEAQQAAQRCGDDRVVAQAALASAEFAIGNEWLGATTTAKLRLAEAAVQRVPQRDLTAEIDVLRARVARRAENLEEAIGRIAGAMDGFAARGRVRSEIRAGLAMLELRHFRGTPEDLAAIQPMLAAWRARAVAELGETDEIVRAIDTRAALCAFGRGELETAHAELERLVRPLPNTEHRRVAGTVVDARGQPVAGATVAAGWSLQGNSLAAAAGFGGSESLRRVTTGPDGRFEILDAVEDPIVIAQLGELRSQPSYGAEDMKLALAPTSRIEGRVDLAGEVPNNVVIVVSDPSIPETMRYALIAPVAHDGSFAIEGLPRRKVRVFAVIEGLHTRIMGGTNLVVRGPVIRGVELSLRANARVVHVLVRSTVNATLANAEVVVLPGKVASTNALAMNQQFQGGTIRFARQIDEHAPRQIVGAARPGDLFATMTEVPDGVASACAFGLPGLWDEELAQKVIKRLERVPVICVPIAADADLVTIEVPPLPRLD